MSSMKSLNQRPLKTADQLTGGPGGPWGLRGWQNRPGLKLHHEQMHAEQGWLVMELS